MILEIFVLLAVIGIVAWIVKDLSHFRKKKKKEKAIAEVHAVYNEKFKHVYSHVDAVFLQQEMDYELDNIEREFK